MDMNVAESIVVVLRVFVVDASFELEATGWHIGDDPFAIPDRVGGFPNGWCTVPHVWILLMPRMESGIQLHIHVRVRREGVQIGHWKTFGTVKDELDGIAGGPIRYGRFIQSASGASILLSGSIFGYLLLPVGRLVDYSGSKSITPVDLWMTRLYIPIPFPVPSVFFILHGRRDKWVLIREPSGAVVGSWQMASRG